MSIDHNDFPSGSGDESKPSPDQAANLSSPSYEAPAGQPLGVSSQVLQDETAATAVPSDSAAYESEVPLSVSSAVEFRVARPGNPVRRLRLTGSRYTFGSGTECSIQLDDETLRPMHAVLLRDAHRILMRAYSVPLECNGARVTEATLRVGDIVRMGNYRFELLMAPGQDDATLVAGKPTQSTASDASAEAPRDRLSELNRQFQSRFAECENRENRCLERESELSGREKDLWGRAESLQKRESELASREAQAQALKESGEAALEELDRWKQLEAEAQESVRQKELSLSQLNSQLEQRQSELKELQSQWDAKENEYGERVSEAQRKFEQTQSQAQSANDTIGRMREEFAAINEQLTELRERHSELQERERREQSEHDRLRGELEQARDRAIDARAKAEADRTEIEGRLAGVNEELQSTRDELERIREEGKRCQEELHEKLRETGEQLQAARADAEETRENFEREKELNASRISDLESRLTEVADQRSDRSTEDSQQLETLKAQATDAEREKEQAEQVAAELRETVNELQESVRRANDETAQLRNDCEGANASIRQLELLVDQNSESQSSRLESWEQESEQLRQTIEELSEQLAQANAELSDLRSVNDALSTEMGTDGDAADQGVGQGSDQFVRLEQELAAARAEIDKLHLSHSETVARLEVERLHSESILRTEIEQLRAEIEAARTGEPVAPSDSQLTESEIETVAGVMEEADGVSEAAGIESVADETVPAGSPTTQAMTGQQEDQTWRVEPEQESAVRRPVDADWSADVSPDQPGEPERSAIDDPLSDETRWQEADAEEHPEMSFAVDDEEGVSWKDESPEQAVVDAIEEIEHSVEQAISDLPDEDDATRLESGWYPPESAESVQGWRADEEQFEEQTSEESSEPIGHFQDEDLDQTKANDPSTSTMLNDEITSGLSVDRNRDRLLDWSAYMPGGDVDSSLDEATLPPGDPSAAADQAEDHLPTSELPIDAEGEVDVEDSLAMSGDWQEYSDSDEEPESVPSDESFGGVESQAFDPHPASAWESSFSEVSVGGVDAASSHVVEPAESEEASEPPAGSLAELLIRDIESASVQTPADESGHRESDFRELGDEEDEGPTVMLNEQPAFIEGEAESDEDWNHDYPDESPLTAVEEGNASDGPPDPPAGISESSGSEPINLADSASFADSVGGEDESIEAYMSRLLQRVQPGDVAVEGQEESPEPPQGVEVEALGTETVEPTVDSEPAQPEILVPRSQAPETKDLGAMRELANQSARNAVARSIRVQARDTQMKAMMKLVMASSFIIMALGVYLFVTWSSTIKLAMIGAFAVLSGVFIQEAVVLYRDARRRLALADESTPADASDEETADENQ